MLFGLFIIFFFISYVISPFHIAGDQVHYNKVYNSVRGEDVFTARQIYLRYIFSFEYLHFGLVWIFSNLGFDKVFIMSILNSAVAVLFARFLLIKSYNPIVVVILLFSNVYLYAMFFTLEKLKVAFLFLLLAVNFRSKFWVLLSCLTHIQVAFVFFSWLISQFLDRFLASRGVIFNSLSLFKFLFFAGFSLFFFSFLKVYIFSKFAFYSADFGLSGFYDISLAALIGSIAFFFSGFRAVCFFYFLILCFAIIAVGPERLNMFAVFGFLFFTRYRNFSERNGFFFVLCLLVLSVFLALKSYHYLKLVIVFGG